MAAQDFRHASQEDNLKVGDFIRRLKQLAYGHDKMLTETRHTLLYSQLQEGLKHSLIETSAVTGANDYLSLCVSAKAEEKRLAELRKRRQYHSDQKQKPLTTARTEVGLKQSLDDSHNRDWSTTKPQSSLPRRYWEVWQVGPCGG